MVKYNSNPGLTPYPLNFSIISGNLPNLMENYRPLSDFEKKMCSLKLSSLK